MSDRLVRFPGSSWQEIEALPQPLRWTVQRTIFHLLDEPVPTLADPFPSDDLLPGAYELHLPADDGERADLGVGGAELRTAVQQSLEAGPVVIGEKSGWRVSQPVTSRTVGRVGGSGALAGAVLVEVAADDRVAAVVAERLDLAEQPGAVAAAYGRALVQVPA